MFLMLPKLTWSGAVATLVSGFYVNVSQALCTGLVMFLLGNAILEKLDRIRTKYGMMEGEYGL